MKEAQVRNRLRVARAELDITQAQLAEMAGVTRQTISLIERDEYNPTIRLCLLLARALGRDVGELFWLEKPGAPEGRAGR
ncbi:MAG: helix-turn-helix transcriptional regulator [Bacillota bacterium]|nr:helix-turn-helix transcriptional regulator [Bacillota bacterium]